jgi:hypothetical protein
MSPAAACRQTTRSIMHPQLQMPQPDAQQAAAQQGRGAYNYKFENAIPKSAAAANLRHNSAMRVGK